MSALPEAVSVDEANRLAFEHGAQPHVVDGSVMSTKVLALDAIGAALSFPEHYGRNLDALYDCLRDLSWLPGKHMLIYTAPEVLAAADPRAYRGIERALTDATDVDRSRFSAVLVRK
jgi:hypothetical protein